MQGGCQNELGHLNVVKPKGYKIGVGLVQDHPWSIWFSFDTTLYRLCTVNYNFRISDLPKRGVPVQPSILTGTGVYRLLSLIFRAVEKEMSSKHIPWLHQEHFPSHNNENAVCLQSIHTKGTGDLIKVIL